MTTARAENATSEITLRWMDESDIPIVARFINECAELEGNVVNTTSPEEMLRWYRHPLNRSRYLLALLKAEDGGEEILAGEADYGPTPDNRHAWAWMHVHPAYRLRGIGGALYGGIVRYAAESKGPAATFTPNKQATLLIEFLERRGYTTERYFWDMQLPADVEVDEKPVLPPGFSVRTFVPGQDEEVFMQVRNVSFAEHYGSSQRTPEEIREMTTQPNFRPEGLFFAFDGDKVAGFCLTAIHPDECERRGEGVGHIDLLGTVPEARGRGVGRALLLTGIEYLRREVPIVELDVEGKNSSALALYKSVGFREHKAWANMVGKGD